MKSPSTPLDVIGSFWPAARPERHLPGHLTFDPSEGGKLEVVRAFHDPHKVLDNAPTAADGSVSVGLSALVGLDSPPMRILGDTTEVSVTLDRCLGTQGTYNVPLVLSGAHIPDGEPLHFQKAEFRFPTSFAGAEHPA